MPELIKNVSVLMPAYNCGMYIAAAVKSILNQTFRNIEFIIIDDGSTDDTEKVIKSFTDGRVVYKRTEHKGTSAALNYGIELCRHEWIARIDADDLNTPDRLERQIQFLEENTEIDILSSWSIYFKDPQKILFLLKEPTGHKEIYNYLDIHNPINQSAMMIRKSIFAANRFNESLDCNEDFELLHRIRDSVRFANMPEFLVYIRLREDSSTITGNRNNLFNILRTESFRKMMDSKSKGDHFYWASVIAWLNYFYGSRADSRSYFKNSVSLKNIIAYFTTFLPEKYFFKFINSHFRYRLNSIFINRGIYKKQLNSLLS